MKLQNVRVGPITVLSLLLALTAPLASAEVSRRVQEVGEAISTDLNTVSSGFAKDANSVRTILVTEIEKLTIIPETLSLEEKMARARVLESLEGNWLPAELRAKITYAAARARSGKGVAADEPISQVAVNPIELLGLPQSNPTLAGAMRGIFEIRSEAEIARFGLTLSEKTEFWSTLLHQAFWSGSNLIVSDEVAARLVHSNEYTRFTGYLGVRAIDHLAEMGTQNAYRAIAMSILAHVRSSDGRMISEEAVEALEKAFDSREHQAAAQKGVAAARADLRSMIKTDPDSAHFARKFLKTLNESYPFSGFEPYSDRIEQGCLNAFRAVNRFKNYFKGLITRF